MLSLRRRPVPDGSRPEWRPIPAWSWMLAAVVAVAVTALIVTVWLLAIAGHAQPGTDRANARLDAVRTGLAAGAGAGAAVGLMLAFRRQHHQEIATVLTDLDATERRITELYTKAVEQLGSAKAPVRLGGLYALERLAQDTPAHRQTIVNVICAYLRMPFPVDPPSSGQTAATADQEAAAESQADTGAGGDAWQQEKQVRLTAQRILTEHLKAEPATSHDQPARPPGTRFWPGISLDLTGATLIDFVLRNCQSAGAIFDGATFTGDAGFNGATFTGGAKFDGATFTGGAWFDGATFTGGAKFIGATFTGDAWFDEGDLHRRRLVHRGDLHRRRRVRRGRPSPATPGSPGRPSLAPPISSGRPSPATPGSSGATFTGAAMFNRATFTRGAMFNGATFTGDAWFNEATFTGDAWFDEGDLHRRRQVRRGDLHPRRLCSRRRPLLVRRLDGLSADHVSYPVMPGMTGRQAGVWLGWIAGSTPLFVRATAAGHDSALPWCDCRHARRSLANSAGRGGRVEGSVRLIGAGVLPGKISLVAA